MSEALCICGHRQSTHKTVDGGGPHDFPCWACKCDKFVAQRPTSEFPAAEAVDFVEKAPGPDPLFGVPSALRHPFAMSEAALSAAFGSLVELRLLIAAVDDVLSSPAPRVEAVLKDEEHLGALKVMVAHRTAIERLAVSQNNARQSVARLDALGDGARRDLATLQAYADTRHGGPTVRSGPASLMPNVDGDGRE